MGTALTLGIKLATIAVQAFNMVEASRTQNKGQDKLVLARDFMGQMLGNCEGDSAVKTLLQTGDKDVQLALNELAAAYAKFQKAVENAKGA